MILRPSHWSLSLSSCAFNFSIYHKAFDGFIAPPGEVPKKYEDAFLDNCIERLDKLDWSYELVCAKLCPWYPTHFSPISHFLASLPSSSLFLEASIFQRNRGNTSSLTNRVFVALIRFQFLQMIWNIYFLKCIFQPSWMFSFDVQIKPDKQFQNNIRPITFKNIYSNSPLPKYAFLRTGYNPL